MARGDVRLTEEFNLFKLLSMRKTKVIGFSIPPETYSRFERVLKGKHKTKSEFFREVLDAYFHGAASSRHAADESDIAHALKAYWDLKSLSSTKVIIVGLGVIIKDGRLLIGARKEKDRWVENLSWVFPGGQLKTLDFADELKRTILAETGLGVRVKSLIASRIHPDSGFKDVQVVALYFYVEPVTEKKEKAANGLAKLKWIKPSDAFKHFTTSVTDEVTKFLMMIEKTAQ